MSKIIIEMEENIIKIDIDCSKEDVLIMFDALKNAIQPILINPKKKEKFGV